MHTDYKTRLLQINLLPLSYRREILDITFFSRSYHGKTDYNVRGTFFVVMTWNTLPDSTEQTLCSLSASLVMKQVINPFHYNLQENTFHPEDTGTWLNACQCPGVESSDSHTPE